MQISTKLVNKFPKWDVSDLHKLLIIKYMFEGRFLFCLEPVNLHWKGSSLRAFKGGNASERPGRPPSKCSARSWIEKILSRLDGIVRCQCSRKTLVLLVPSKLLLSLWLCYFVRSAKLMVWLGHLFHFQSFFLDGVGCDLKFSLVQCNIPFQ
jgi:hypothetical protein